MENLDYSDYFSSFNNAFGLHSEAHKTNGKNNSVGYIEPSDDTSYCGFVDDLTKAFSKYSTTPQTGLPTSRDYDGTTCSMTQYIFRDQPHLAMTRERSASAPIPITKLNAAKCLFSRYEKKRPSCRSTRSDSLTSSSLKRSSLSLNDSPSDDEVFLDDDDDDVMVTSNAMVQRERAMTAPLQ